MRALLLGQDAPAPAAGAAALRLLFRSNEEGSALQWLVDCFFIGTLYPANQPVPRKLVSHLGASGLEAMIQARVFQ